MKHSCRRRTHTALWLYAKDPLQFLERGVRLWYTCAWSWAGSSLRQWPQLVLGARVFVLAAAR